MGDRGCDLECVKYDKAGDNTIEFVGPVKIVLVDQPKSKYIRKKYSAALIVLAQMLMIATTLLVMFFSLSYKKSTYLKALHILLCTVGLQIIIPSGILALNKLNGSSAPMKPHDRRFEHLFLQCFGLACSVSGAVISYFSDFTTLFTLHSYFGFVAVALGIISGFTGLCIYPYRSEALSSFEDKGFFHRCVYFVHRIVGISTFTLSSACFVMGIVKTPFVKWIPLDDMCYFSIVFCIFYTMVIIYKPIKGLL